MTLTDLERKSKSFMNFFGRFRAATQIHIIHKVAPHYYRYASQIGDFGIFILT